MQYIVMFIVGLLTGAVARFVLPGADSMGWIMTSILGIVGSYVGGFIGNIVSGGSASTSNIRPAGFILSVVGSIAVLLIARLVF